MQVIGFYDGYEGLIQNRYTEIGDKDASGILALGGTILGTSNRADPFHFPVLQDESYVFLDRSAEAVRNFEALGLDVLLAIGGDGTMAASAGMAKKGIPVIGVPKTIDNDLVGTDITFGFDTAVATATEAIDRIHTTAQSHHRVMVVEVMGRYAGWLALSSGLAGGGDIILMPEFPYDIEAVCDAVRTRNARGKKFSIAVVGEGSRPMGGELTVKRMIENSPDAVRLGGVSNQVAAQIEDSIKIECRVTILGHLLRGGSPTAFDRLLATRFGVAAADQAAKAEFGKMVALQKGRMTTVPIEDVAGKLRLVRPDDSLVRVAQSIGVCLGHSRQAALEESFTEKNPTE
jgi:6-phosphofructokinase 1